MKKKSSRQSTFNELYEIAWPELSSFLLNDLPVNINLVDTQGYIAWGNKRMLDALNLHSLDEFVGKHISTWDMPNEIRWEYCEKVIKSGKEITIEESFKDVHYLAIRKPIIQNNKVMGILGISIDITERKQAEEALKLAKQKAEVANQAKTEFLENMRHDIRTPVAGIIGCAQLIQSQASNAEKVTEFSADLVESSDALLEFLNKVLESIKVASGEIPLLKKKFDLHNLLEQIIHLNKSYAVSKNLELNLDYDDVIPKYVMGDPIRIQRIVLELVTNALKFTEKGEIKVTARLMKEKNHVERVIVKISVSDTGIGIPLNKQNEVYTRFKRLTPSYQGIYSGTGLGLSVVKQFMDDLGGELSLQSKPRQGSTFTCLLPFQESLLMDGGDVEVLHPIENNASKKVLVANESLVELSDASRSRVLVVEDNAMAAKVAQHILSKLHYQIDIAESGKKALALIEQYHYDLILMDIGLPDNDGGEVTRRIRLKQWKRSSSVHIVGLTAHIDAENKRRCLDAGMNAIYIKPLTPAKASEILNAFIPHYHQLLPPATFTESVNPVKGLSVLDIDRAVEFMGSKEFVKEGLALLVSSLTEELEVIKQRHQENDWQAIKTISHKWRGGAGYCGTRRLEEACRQLETYLQMESLEQAESLYQQLIQEAESAKEAAKKYIS
jgi:two-component system aerobic respiration control sensor histidine kinase ArcB